MNKNLRQYLYILVIWIVFPNFSSAWDNNFTHPEITKQAIHLLINYSPLYQGLGEFAYLDGYGMIRDKENQLSYIDEGSVKEDTDWDFGPIVGGWNKDLWGDKQTGDIWVTSYLNHGFNHRTGASWDGWYCNLCENISDCHLCDNALQYSDELWTVVRTSGPVAIRNYILPDQGNWYFQAGRLAHLIQDMTSPSHVHADPHNPDGVEHYAETNFAWLNYLPGSRVRQPLTDGLPGYNGQNTPRNFIQNLARRTYNMTSYYGGNLVAEEGIEQPDSELKRMFPDLRYITKDGKDCWTINGIGDYCVGDDEDENEWWKCPGDTGYYYYIETDGNNGGTVIPQVFKKSKFKRIELDPSFDKAIIKATLDESLEENARSKTLRDIYIENLFPLAIEWTAGFLQYFYDEIVGHPPVAILSPLAETPIELIANQGNQSALMEVAVQDEHGGFIDTLTEDDFVISIEGHPASIVQANPFSGRYFITFSAPSLSVGSYNLFVSANIDGQTSSSPWSYQFNAVVYKLPAPTNVMASDGEYANRVHISWDSVPGASFYRVYRMGDPLENFWQVGTTYDDFSAVSDRAYPYQVQAATDNLDAGFLSLTESGFQQAESLFYVDGFSDGIRIWSLSHDLCACKIYRGTTSLLSDASIVKDEDNSDDCSYSPSTGYAWRDYDVLPWNTYYYRLKCDGYTLSSPKMGVIPFLTSISVGVYPHKIAISWDEVNWATYYQVYRSTTQEIPPNPNTASPIGTWQLGTSYSDYDVEPGKSYCYWIRGATSSTGNHASQFDESYECRWGPSLPIPTGVSASEGAYTDKVRIIWDASPGFDYYYRVYRGTDSDQEHALPLGEWQQTTSFDDYSAIPGILYMYWVKLSTSGTGTYSSEFSRSNASGYRMLTAPSGVTASKNPYYCRVKLRWESAPGAYSYYVYRGEESNLSDAIRIWISSETFYDDYSAKCGQPYYYAVSAVNDYGSVKIESAQSLSVQGSHSLPAPTGVFASNGIYPDKIEVQWNSVPGIQYYSIYRSTDSNFTTFTELARYLYLPGTNFTDYTVPVAWQKYYYAVKAACPGSTSEGKSGESNAGRLLWEQTLTASDAVYTDKVSIIWASYGNGYYRVYRHSENNPDDAIILSDWQKGGAYEDFSAVPGQTYYYWIKVALDASGAQASDFSPPDTGSRKDPTQTYYQLTIFLYGNGSHIASNPFGLNCYGSICFLDYIEGTQVTLTAVPKANSNFIRWGGSWCSGTEGCTVTVNANKMVFAYFSGPDINIKRDNTNYPNGATNIFIGTASIGSSIQVHFSIENTGNEELLIEGDASNLIDIQGINANEFSITQQPNTVISAGGSTSFTIQFTPTSTGNRTATLSIANNDNDENPYTLTLVGEGKQQNSYLLWTK